jgi:putative protein kinase ArgK-like GTPase of G3E family
VTSERIHSVIEAMMEGDRRSLARMTTLLESTREDHRDKGDAVL